ncbi:MAG: type III pantothenate kinase [Gammaproteobacteria bacterium]|nr:type III pantothenate kinase [Gammaproteobacteria bacterium]
MSTLVVDIGNARIKWARADGPRIAAPGNLPHAGRAEAAIEAAVAAFPGDTDRMVVSNVAGEDTAAALAALAAARFGLRPELVRPAAEGFGVRCGYREPARLGADRWVSVVAAHRAAAAEDRRARAACVINAGTALTLDAVDAGGRHVGGLIMPGPRIVAAALERNTRRIGATSAPAAVPSGLGLFGTSTDEAVGHAALLGPAAAFDRAIALFARETGEQPIVFLAGGDAEILKPWLETEVRLRADFVLEGLAMIADRTTSARP